MIVIAETILILILGGFWLCGKLFMEIFQTGNKTLIIIAIIGLAISILEFIVNMIYL